MLPMVRHADATIFFITPSHWDLAPGRARCCYSAGQNFDIYKLEPRLQELTIPQDGNGAVIDGILRLPAALVELYGLCNQLQQTKLALLVELQRAQGA